MACTETFAALRIFSEDVHPDEMSSILGVSASRTIPHDPSAKYRVRREMHYWVWQTKNLDSTDNEQHLAAIIEKFRDRSDALEALRDKGCQTDISNYWVSNGQGGPMLELEMMAALCELGLPIWWDMYFEDDDGTES